MNDQVRSLELFCPSFDFPSEAIVSWQDTMSKPWEFDVDLNHIGDKGGFLVKCQSYLERSKADVLGYLHNDLFIHEHGWDQRVLEAFSDPQVGIVGFVGALGLGQPAIYRIPYAHTQLARYCVLSNLSDAETHGTRFTAVRRVAVVDSCACFLRRSFLERAGGWPVARYPNSSHCSDLWCCLMAARLGYSVLLVGVGCTHRSGGKGEAGSQWLEAHGGDLAMHRQAHALIYKDFRDILPVRVS